jgi:Pyridoxamine 5'-phosphate oxidase
VPTNDEDRILEVLDDAECRRLFGAARMGRLGYTDGALPAILPVQFTIHDDWVRIPARQGNRIIDAVRRAVVAVSVDEYDFGDRTGWGVTVVGPAQVVPAGMHDGPLGGAGPLIAGRCVIVVRMGLLRGWRLILPAGIAG